MKNQKNIILALAIMFIVTMVAFIRSAYQNDKLRADLDRQAENISVLLAIFNTRR